MAAITSIFGSEEKVLQGRLSQAAVQFLDYVEEHPELLGKNTFEAVQKRQKTYPFDIQPWPILVDQKWVGEMSECAVAIDRLTKSLFQRYFHDDTARISAFLSLKEEEVGLMFSKPNGMAEAISRADCLLAKDGFKCMELNCGSNLSGWEMDYLGKTVLMDAANQAFFKEYGLKVSYRKSIQAVMGHLVALGCRHDTFDGKTLNVAVTLPALHEGVYSDIHNPWIYKNAFMEELARQRPGVRGRLLPCHISDIKTEGDRLSVHGHQLNAIYEQHGDATPFSVIRASKAGGVELVTGPASALLLDKRLLALLSQYARGGMFDDQERALIEKYLPWTRLANTKEIDYGGQQVSMADLLANHKENLVLKDGTSGGGKGVYVGRYCPADRWEAAAREAMADSRFIVQEFISSEPFVFQNGEDGYCPQDLAWGFVTVNGSFEGAYLRMMPVGAGGIVNAAQGASEGVALEIEPA